MYACFGLQEMSNINIVEAARTGSLQRVKQALKDGVPVDTTNEVCNFDLNQNFKRNQSLWICTLL